MTIRQNPIRYGSLHLPRQLRLLIVRQCLLTSDTIRLIIVRRIVREFGPHAPRQQTDLFGDPEHERAWALWRRAWTLSPGEQVRNQVLGVPVDDRWRSP